MLYAADRVRCHQTVEPLAEELGVTIHNEPTADRRGLRRRTASAARHRVLEIAAAAGTPVICTQGKVIPDLIAWWCERDGVRPDKSRNRKGSTWVLSLAGRTLDRGRPHRQPAGRQDQRPDTQIRRGRRMNTPFGVRESAPDGVDRD